eukprot:TRINITY_DN49544_c0_g1_i1.p1 TRINITY_DN49544_c0_g1~~TRINITY_DN49544_c0_g1_i1.p1  ORF type:complete len:181 (-),score=21.98 TRINITY_DN49544_c0_g1_i1:96-638(-)
MAPKASALKSSKLGLKRSRACSTASTQISLSQERSVGAAPSKQVTRPKAVRKRPSCVHPGDVKPSPKVAVRIRAKTKSKGLVMPPKMANVNAGGVRAESAKRAPRRQPSTEQRSSKESKKNMVLAKDTFDDAPSTPIRRTRQDGLHTPLKVPARERVSASQSAKDNMRPHPVGKRGALRT